jgi:hypothetical protein
MEEMAAVAIRSRLKPARRWNQSLLKLWGGVLVDCECEVRGWMMEPVALEAMGWIVKAKLEGGGSRLFTREHHHMPTEDGR